MLLAPYLNAKSSQKVLLYLELKFPQKSLQKTFALFRTKFPQRSSQKNGEFCYNKKYEEK